MAEESLAEFEQCLQVFLSVVDVLEEQILKGHASVGSGDVAEEGFLEIDELLVGYAWHKGISLSLDGGVEGDCEGELLGFAGE